MRVDGPFGHDQLEGDLTVGATACDQPCNLPLADGELVQNGRFGLPTQVTGGLEQACRTGPLSLQLGQCRHALDAQQHKLLRGTERPRAPRATRSDAARLLMTRQCEPERGALPEGALDSHTAALLLHQALDNAQPQSQAAAA